MLGYESGFVAFIPQHYHKLLIVILNNVKNLNEIYVLKVCRTMVKNNIVQLKPVRFQKTLHLHFITPTTCSIIPFADFIFPISDILFSLLALFFQYRTFYSNCMLYFHNITAIIAIYSLILPITKQKLKYSYQITPKAI